MRKLTKISTFIFIFGFVFGVIVSAQAADVIVGTFRAYIEWTDETYVHVSILGSGAISPSDPLETRNNTSLDTITANETFTAFAESLNCIVGRSVIGGEMPEDLQIYFTCMSQGPAINKVSQLLQFPLTLPFDEPSN
jgi:hypothetical protein